MRNLELLKLSLKELQYDGGWSPMVRYFMITTLMMSLFIRVVN